MVLQDLGDVPPPDDFGEGPSANDNYNNPSGRRFDESQIPQPIPVLSRLVGYSPPVVRYKTEQTIKFAEQRINRSLTPVETQALAMHLYQMERTKSHFAITGASLGIVRSYMTMAANKYPFYNPKPADWSPNKFLFVTGPYAQVARQMWRFSLFTLIGAEFGKLVGQIIAQPAAAQATASDPLLAQFADDLRASGTGKGRSATDLIEGQRRTELEEARNKFENARNDFWKKRNGQGTEELPPHAGAPRPWGRQAKSEPRAVPSSDNDDDMSPTAGNDGWSYSNADSFGDSSSSPTSPQDDSQTSQGRRREHTSAWNKQSSRSADYDDASPTAGFSQDQTQDDSNPGESAWDRLRRGGDSTLR